MTQPQMDEQSRNLILAAEISGLLHDLGKLCPEFALEKMGAVNYRDAIKDLGFNDAHGSILEDQQRRFYPPASDENWLSVLRQHQGWKQALQIPLKWCKLGTLQAHGLGDPLRQHHSNRNFPHDQLSFLGLLYTYGADIRDSAMDKGSGGTRHGDQRVTHGFIADSFGNECKPYGPTELDKLWSKVRQVFKGGEGVEGVLNKSGAWLDVRETRKVFFNEIEEFFREALGDTRRPTNDVTLWHHAYSTASLFKAAVAEKVLRKDFTGWQKEDGSFDEERMGRVRFRLLGIRWDWVGLAGGVLQPVALTALAENRRLVIVNLRQRLELDYPVGNLVYEDNNGAIFVVGGFYQGPEDIDGSDSEREFQKVLLDPLQTSLLEDTNLLGAGMQIRLAWTKPRLYLTDYPDIMAVQWKPDDGNRQRLLQTGEAEFRALWNKKTGAGQQIQICPQCGLRPAEARELALNESGLGSEKGKIPPGLCNQCQSLVSVNPDQRFSQANKLFGFRPNNFNLHDIRSKRNRSGNARVVMLSVQVNPEAIATGSVLLSQLARPLADFKREDVTAEFSGNHQKVGEWIQKILDDLSAGIGDKKLAERGELARALIGDQRWLRKDDGRAEGTLKEKARHLLDEFFLREFIPTDAGLYRHDGDRLLLFGMRKHASPGRLARTWDDLRALWQQILWDIAGDTQQWLMPLSLDAGGFRVIVAANDARKALGRIQQGVNERLNKVRAGLDVHVSALAFREKFPLYIALDALRRMERRVTDLRPQNWTLRSMWKRQHDGTPALQPEDRVQEVVLDWDTEQGPVQWTVNLRTGDPEQPDLWYPHAICTSRPEGPGRLVRLDQLEPGETIRLRPSTFDFIALDGTARRYDLRYDEQGRRPHLILGEPGRRPYLLEQLGELLDLPRQTGWDISQTKGLLGQIIECYEKWVRDVPNSSRADGREAWRGHCTAIFRRYLKDQPAVRDRLIALLQHEEQICLLFDAFEWSGFIEKDAHSRVAESEPA